ncbi:carbon-nitrogen hydrolase family protein [Hamadaea sp. NPDC051192]|uniref:carbon-nitrogen hydrolase family protein n=1 Tax=Hamadaea sp. NPDC051192 TaxID=3154940 RepID=UPI003448D182
MITAAVIQIGSYLFDTHRTLDKLVEKVRQAAAEGAELIVLPEAILGGYPKGLSFGVHVGSRSEDGREMFRRYHESAIEIPGPETQTLCDLSTQLNVHLVTGAVERRGATLYCVAVFISPGAGVTGVHRKLMPTAAERFLWGSGDGSTLHARSMGNATVGAAICWENYMPLFRTAMYAKGVNVWCAPTVDDRESWQSTMRHIAVEGRCFVLSACQYVTRADFPDDVTPVQGDEPDRVLIGGGSVIISPMGHILAEASREKEQILIATLDLDDITRARFDLDVVGHYARPDIFALTVDERDHTRPSPHPATTVAAPAPHLVGALNGAASH